MLYETNELRHHGVLGMKWGVHRYQNADGSLTPRGERQFDKVANNPRLAKRDTKRMLFNLKRDINDGEAQARIKARKIDSLTRKANKLVDKNTINPSQKTESKYWKTMAKLAISKKEMVDLANRLSNSYGKVEKVRKGTIKAGRDFIVQRDIDGGPIVLPVPSGLIVGAYASATDRIIERKRGK